MVRITIAFLGVLLVTPAFAAAPDAPKPSFDCAAAKSKVKLMICGSDELARLDVAEEALLRRARAKATTPDAVNEEQSLWLSRRDTCTSAACLTRAYRGRIAGLHAWTD